MSGFFSGSGISFVRRAFFALSILLGAAAATPAAAQSVSVVGNKRVETETIRSFVSLAPGESYTAARIDQAIKDLFATGLFSDVRITRQGSGVVVRVVENALVNRVSFQGNSKVKTEVLIGEVQTRSRGAFNQSIIDQDVARIREIYARSGRAGAKVDALVSPLPDGRSDVVFKIDEGSKTAVDSIVFQGNRAFSAWKLKSVMQTTESNFLSFLKSSDIYDPNRVAADLEALRRFYLKNGYADFRVVNSNAQLKPDGKGYVLTIAVDEGERYTVAGVDVESRIVDVDAARLKGEVRTRSGDIYNAEDVEKSVDAISREVAKRGYAFAQVRPRGDRDPANKSLRIVYAVEEGPRVYVERIVVRGNTRTRDYVIRREFDLGEGDAYNKAAIDRAERRLRNLGFFKTVRITNEPGSAPDRVVVNVDVEDQATGSFSISGGYSTTEGFLAEVSVQETNFGGRGQYARAAVSNGQKSRGVELSFTEPFFMDRRIAAGFDIFSKFSDSTDYARYRSRNTGFTLRAGVPITEEFSVGTRYTLYSQKISIPNSGSKLYKDCDGTLFAPLTANPCIANGEASIAIKEAAGRTVTSLVGLTFAYNTLDNIKDPTKGIYAELKPEVAGAGGDSRFVRAIASARYYHPLTDDFIGMLKVQGGHMAAFGDRKLRVLDHFYMGPDLVRGFAPSGIGPRDRNGDSGANAVGGTTYLGTTAEVTFPIFGIPREIGLRGAVFADAGTLFGYKGKKQINLNGNGTYDCVDPGNTRFQSECLSVRDEKAIRSSIGAGLLWASPLGPIRFDYAYALTRVKNGALGGGDRTQAFRFSGGASF
jgi:outer membrane protein insertion porin family